MWSYLHHFLFHRCFCVILFSKKKRLLVLTVFYWPNILPSRELITGLPQANPVIKWERGCLLRGKMTKLRNLYPEGIVCVLRFRCLCASFRTIEESILGVLEAVQVAIILNQVLSGWTYVLDPWKRNPVNPVTLPKASCYEKSVFQLCILQRSEM